MIKITVQSLVKTTPGTTKDERFFQSIIELEQKLNSETFTSSNGIVLFPRFHFEMELEK